MDMFEEIRAVSAEAARLAREGGSVEERAAHDARKARVMAALEEQATRAIAPVVGTSQRTVSNDMQVSNVAHLNTETGAIAPVVGVSQQQVQRDTQVTPHVSPDMDTETGEVSDDYPNPEVLPAGVGGALSRLPVELKRPVVNELTQAGLSPNTIAPVLGVTRQRVSQIRAEVEGANDLHPAVNVETGEVSDDYPESGTGPKCQDWPLCGHDDGHACEEHAAIARTIERTKSALRERGAL